MAQCFISCNCGGAVSFCPIPPRRNIIRPLALSHRHSIIFHRTRVSPSGVSPFSLYPSPFIKLVSFLTHPLALFTFPHFSSALSICSLFHSLSGLRVYIYIPATSLRSTPPPNPPPSFPYPSAFGSLFGCRHTTTAPPVLCLSARYLNRLSRDAAIVDNAEERERVAR